MMLRHFLEGAGGSSGKGVLTEALLALREAVGTYVKSGDIRFLACRNVRGSMVRDRYGNKRLGGKARPKKFQ